MFLCLYRFITFIFLPIISLHLRKRKAKGKEDAFRFEERLGKPSKERPEGRLIWFHGASVGESVSMLPLINKILEADNQCHILVTTGTVTSAKIMAERLPERAFHQYIPIDIYSYANSFMKHWRPDLCLWFESDMWPNLLSVAKKRGVVMALLNGRMSDKSFSKWKWCRFLAKSLLSSFSMCLGQTEEDADRLSKLGAKNVSCEGNLKYAADVLPVSENDLIELSKQIGIRKVWLASSTHKGEEEIILQVHEHIKSKIPDILTVIVPRHPERGDEIAKELSKNNQVKVDLRSQTREIGRDTDIYIANTIGELGLFYRAIPVVLIGKTLLAPGGGQNPIEPAKLGCAIVMGEHTANFREISNKMANSNAAVIMNFEFSRREDGIYNLAEEIISLIKNTKLREKYSANAIAFANNEASVLDRVYSKIESLISKKL